MQIPANCLALKHIDNKWKDFKTKPRNTKLSVRIDDVAPFSMQSTWPVIVINYNLPPYIE